MNPPQSFLDASALSNPAPAGPVSNPVIFGQNGQAVLVGGSGGDAAPAQNAPNADNQSPTQPAAAAAGADQIAQKPVPSAQTQTNQASTTNTIDANAQTAPSTSPSPPTTATQQTTSPSPSIVDATPSSLVSISSATSLSAMSIVASVSSADPSSATISTTVTSISTSTAPSSSASASATAASSVLAAARPFTRSPLFIVLCVLGSLVVLSVIATSLSWIVRRSGARCCVCCDQTRSHEDDGLSEVVDSFHSHSYDRQPSMMSTSTFGTNGPSTALGLTFVNDSTPGVAGVGMGSGEVKRIDERDQRELHRRSTTLAKYPEQSPYLHSGYANGFPVLHDVEDVRDERGMHGPQGEDRLSAAWAPLHTGGVSVIARDGGAATGADDARSIATSEKYANLGPLEIRNLSPGDFDKESTIYNWARQTTIKRNQSVSTVTRANSLNQESPDEAAEAEMSRRTSSRLTVPNFNPPHPHGYVDSRISSRSTTRDLQLGRSASHLNSTDDEGDGPRAGTWASSLRDTLFAAIQGVRGPVMSDVEQGDTYTRAAAPLPTRRSIRRDLAGGETETSEIIAGYFLTPSLSGSTSRESDSLRQTRTSPVKQSRKLPDVARGRAGDRYKRYFSRSSRDSRDSSSGDESLLESSDSWTVMRGPKRAASGPTVSDVKLAA